MVIINVSTQTTVQVYHYQRSSFDFKTHNKSMISHLPNFLNIFYQFFQNLPMLCYLAKVLLVLQALIIFITRNDVISLMNRLTFKLNV